MATTTVIATRVPDDYARSLRQIAELRKTTVSDVVGRIILEQVAPSVEPTSEQPAAA